MRKEFRQRTPFIPAMITVAVSVNILLAYSFLPYHWPSVVASNGIVMHLQLGSPGSTLIDGSTSWDRGAEHALAVWNNHLNGAMFLKIDDSTIPIRANDGKNSVFFDSDVFGDPFGATTLAVTTSWTSGGSRTEADVIFNSGRSWNSYRGNLRSGIAEFRRVALHEFGHALGLDHPDEDGQSVTAMMNSSVSNLDALASDDISAAAALSSKFIKSPVTNLRLVRGKWRVRSKRAKVQFTVRNNSNFTSGTIKMVLWMSKRRYPSRGYRVAEKRGRMGPNQTKTYRFSTRAKLPRRSGRYRTTMVIEEFTSKGWRRKHWLTAGSMKIGRR